MAVAVAESLMLNKVAETIAIDRICLMFIGLSKGIRTFCGFFWTQWVFIQIASSWVSERRFNSNSVEPLIVCRSFPLYMNTERRFPSLELPDSGIPRKLRILKDLIEVPEDISDFKGLSGGSRGYN